MKKVVFESYFFMILWQKEVEGSNNVFNKCKKINFWI